jgi:signal transduction histidine kinase/ActR/RegA family two-component response regulator
MKVRTKLALLLLIVVGAFAAGLAAIKTYDFRKYSEAMDEYARERQVSFDAFLQRWTQSLQVLVEDQSCWDAMESAVRTGDGEWASANLDDAALAMGRANAIWVYSRDSLLFYSHNNLYSDLLTEVPLPRAALGTWMKERKRAHFFAETPVGIFEVRGASIHPSRDQARATEPVGYLLLGRFWSREELKDISMLTGHTIEMRPMNAATETTGDARIGMVTFTRELPGWNGIPLRKLIVRNDSPVLHQLHGSSERQFLWLLLFTVVVFLLLLVFLTRWVDGPIQALAKCLRKQSLEPIASLQNDPCEFGDFARLIRDFFEQRARLLREVKEREDAEQALHQSEERLRHSQKMEAVGRLAGGIAHDFNNLLTAIIGYADLIAHRERGDGSTQADAEQIARAGEKAAALTRQLLAFSRKQVLQPRVIDLNALLLELKKLLHRVIGEHIDLEVRTTVPEARVKADSHQIEQVILNLGVNARDAMPAGGRLTLETGETHAEEGITDGTLSLPPGTYVKLTVRDTGCGMTPETLDRVFEPFFTTKEPGKGTGLGLATVYGIVQQSGGGIAVQSTPGVGTTFAIYLPHEDAPLDPPPAVSPPVQGSKDAETVLVVEDDEIVRELVCAVLGDQGYEVLCASHGVEALAMARTHRGPIHLLVSDVVMPQMHGPQLAEELGKFRPDTRVLFVSGYSDSDISDQGILSANIRLLEKPFTPESLARKVREVLDEKLTGRGVN